ncbi:MAG: hypothetical protein HRT71_22055 [Flavobacteriales bacterium]|nr:hypothetical protein [Flavobacteriales bacterium]
MSLKSFYIKVMLGLAGVMIAIWAVNMVNSSNEPIVAEKPLIGIGAENPLYELKVTGELN